MRPDGSKIQPIDRFNDLPGRWDWGEDTLEFALRVPYFARTANLDPTLLTVLETLALLVTRIAGEDVEREYRKRLVELDRTGEIPAPKDA